MVRATTALVALALAARTTAAQQGAATGFLTNIEETSGSARLVGFGGAFVGLADDVSASRANPAGLMALPRSLDSAVPLGATGRPRFRPAYVGLAFHPYKDLAVAFDWARTERQPLEDVAAGAEDASVSGWSVSAAVRAERRVFLGGSLRGQRLSVGTGVGAVSAWAPELVAGLYVRPDTPEAPHVGVTYARRVRWNRATGPSTLDVRLPTTIAIGVSWHYDIIRNARLTFGLQEDFRRYEELNGIVALPEGERIHDEHDLRAGVEASIPFDCTSGCGTLLQVRAGIVNRGPVPLRDGSSAASSGQGPARRNSWFLGASFAPRWPLAGKMKVDGAYNRDRRSFVFSLAFRYPEAYRADLIAVRGHH